MKIRSESNCKHRRPHYYCADSIDNSSDSCQEDSGGPLVVGRERQDGSMQYTIAGVDASGSVTYIEWPQYACVPGPNIISLYSKVSLHLDWIKNNLKGNFCKDE